MGVKSNKTFGMGVHPPNPIRIKLNLSYPMARVFQALFALKVKGERLRAEVERKRLPTYNL